MAFEKEVKGIKLDSGLYKDDLDLENVDLPETLEIIGAEAFRGCESLREIHLPESVKVIEKGAFACCESLKKINLPAGLLVIEENAFFGCYSLTIPELPEGLLKIGSNAFHRCTIEKCCLGKNIEELGESAFSGCDLPNGIEIHSEKLQIPNFFEKSYEIYLFGEDIVWKEEEQCSSLSVYKYSDFDLSRRLVLEPRHVAYHLIEGEISEVDEFMIQNNALVAYIGADEIVHVPENVRYIAEDAFVGAKQIKKLYLPENLVAVASGAFAPLENLDAICALGKNTRVFAGLSVNEAMNPVKIHVMKDSFSDLNYEDECESGCYFEEKVTMDIVSYRIDGEGTFWDYEGELEEFTVPEGVKALGMGCFASIDYLEKVNLPEGLISIGKSAFEATVVEVLYLPSSVKVLGDQAFYDAALKIIELPEGLETIGKEAFRHSELIIARIPSTVKFIGELAFNNCSNLRTVICHPTSYVETGFEVFDLEQGTTFECPSCLFENCL